MRKRMGYYYQGGLNKKEIQLNICNIFLFRFMKYLASALTLFNMSTENFYSE